MCKKEDQLMCMLDLSLEAKARGDVPMPCTMSCRQEVYIMTFITYIMRQKQMQVIDMHFTTCRQLAPLHHMSND